MKFRHRPTEVEAQQWYWPGSHKAEAVPGPIQAHLHTALVIRTKDGTMKDLHPGDFILTYPDGSHDVMEAVAFRRLYDPVLPPEVPPHPTH